MRKLAKESRSRRENVLIQSRSVFSERLRTLMAERGLTVTDVADRVRQHLPDGENFATSNLSHYRQGRSVPRPGHLNALSLALGVDASELTARPEADSADRETLVELSGSSPNIPSRVAGRHRVATVDEKSAVIRVEDFGTEMRLVVDQRVTWEQAIQILKALKARNEP